MKKISRNTYFHFTRRVKKSYKKALILFTVAALSLTACGKSKPAESPAENKAESISVEEAKSAGKTEFGKNTFSETNAAEKSTESDSIEQLLEAVPVEKLLPPDSIQIPSKESSKDNPENESPGTSPETASSELSEADLKIQEAVNALERALFFGEITWEEYEREVAFVTQTFTELYSTDLDELARQTEQKEFEKFMAEQNASASTGSSQGENSDNLSISDRLGFTKGDTILSENGKTYIYQGNNKWLLKNTNAYFLAIDTQNGGFDLEWQDPKNDPAYIAAMNSKMTFVVHGEEITITQREYQQLSEVERSALMNGMTTEEYIEHWNKIMESAKKAAESITQEEIDLFIRSNS